MQKFGRQTKRPEEETKETRVQTIEMNRCLKNRYTMGT